MAVRQKSAPRYSSRPYDSKASARYDVRATTRRRPKARFFAILTAVLAVIVMVIALVVSAQATSPVEWGKAEFSASYDMLIIRTEVVYEGKNYGKTDFIAEEGQQVAAGDPIAEAYSWEYNDDTLSQLLDLQETILNYEINVSRAGVIDPQLVDINSRISAKVTEIEQSAQQSPQDSLKLQRELEVLLDERMTYMKSVVVPDETLLGYYEDEQALLTTIGAWRTQLIASQNGVVSFYFDGCEKLMTPSNIGKFTDKKALEEVAAGKTVETEESDAAYAPLYRIVDTGDWYVVMYSADAIPEMHEGNAFSLIFDDYLDYQYTGVVYNATVLEENGGFVYTVRIQDDIGPLIGERRVTAKLYGEQEGLQVPKNCVETTQSKNENDEDVTYTYVETSDGQFVPIEIIADDGDYYMVRTYEGQPTLSQGQRIRG